MEEASKKWALFFLWVLMLLLCCSAAKQLPYLQPVDQLYSIHSPLTSPVIPGEVLHNWFGTGQTKLTQKDGVDMVQLTGMEPDSFGILYHVAPLKQQNFNISYVYWIGTTEFQPRVDYLTFWYTKYPPTYGPIYGNEVAFQGLGIVIQLFDSQRRGPSLFPVINEKNSATSDERNVKMLSPGCLLGSLTGKIYVAYQQDKVSVYQLPIQKDAKPNPKLCFEAEIPPAARLSSGYLGFTAKSEKYATEHNIIQVTVATGKTESQQKAEASPMASKNSAPEKTFSTTPKVASNKPASGRRSNTMTNAPMPSEQQNRTPWNKEQHQEKGNDINAPKERRNQQLETNSGNVQQRVVPQESVDLNPNMQHLQDVWDDTNEKQVELLSKFSQLLIEWQGIKRTTFITMIFVIALLVLLQFYACVFYLYYRKLASRLRYTKII